MPRGVSSALRLLLHHLEQAAVPRRPGCPATAAAAPRYLALCRCSVCHAGSGNCQGCRVSLVARAARFSSDHHPLEQCAPARARACSRAHTCVRVHAHPPPVVATCSPNRDQVIVSDLLCLYAFVHVVEWPKLNGKVQICEMDLIGWGAGATVNLGCM